MADLRLAGGVNAERQDDRKSLLNGFDDVRRDIDASGTMKGLDAFTARAFDMVASGAVRKALDLNNEEPRSRDRYKGIEQFLTARRLIEAGVGCVTLSIGGWDTHSSNFKTLRKQLPEVDRGVANLIQDLHDRGMQDDVVTVMWGEFGRTPKINGNDGGRDHWSPAMSALVAGGGLKMGQAIGATSARGEYPKRPPLHRAATAEHALPGDRHRPVDDVPQRQRPADVRPRRPRAGGGAAVSGDSVGANKGPGGLTRSARPVCVWAFVLDQGVGGAAAITFCGSRTATPRKRWKSATLKVRDTADAMNNHGRHQVGVVGVLSAELILRD